MPLTLDLTGKIFNRLTVLHRGVPHRDPDGVPRTTWVCHCQCGTVVTVQTDSLRRGSTQSCGCLTVERCHRVFRKHGYANPRNRLYHVWGAMIQRCTNPNDRGWANYGGRGITVCERWRSFENFLADMGERPAGLTLDRIDNDRGYEPGNCRWTTWGQQLRNRRQSARTHWITYQGHTLSVTDWARRLQIKAGTLVVRLSRGWSVHDAFTRVPGARVPR